ncbi:hypothetical protein [uncultured Bacteroides sp.]|uniref:hypothetical protein n=1 Tax=uncultured Bacteroides sp. TaxID=162156 RepID=UPI00262118F8|nr:hypothetical protein [uncultured Bacteroides sp.]
MLKRKNTLDNGEEDFYASLAAECRHWQDCDGRLPLRKNSIPGRLHDSGKAVSGISYKGMNIMAETEG